MPPPADRPPTTTEPGADLPAPVVELALEEEAWADALGGEAEVESLAARGAAMALAAAGVSAQGRAVSFLFADDRTIAGLNDFHRGKPTPTNVLSWPAWELGAAPSGLPDGTRPLDPPEPEPAPEMAGFPAMDDEGESLGDLALAYQTCAREAEALGLPLRDHALHLILHGTLHLLGYDHVREADAALMEGLETEAMLAAGLADPYRSADDFEEAGRPAAAERTGSDGL
ncbi:rRNA maturation RNase YbeY [Albimonas sp. CAU 1670]|uniref:rRNA maturation RNase YbeY n=1 Tax=Albimonas sp. CAU 1670 TaxID=3032599 RepID=UPI0023D9F221|nr:rRNA maturation RNase YbeY [Albimonas sp. CAU 1670]MDF2234674.1 rRNA maturation RNase YbeY [Albimonas sp. CAU 1670]